MYGSELRTYSLSAVVSVLFGAGIGLGWHYFVDSAGATVLASVQLPPPSRMRPILHSRTLLPRERVQLSVSPGYQIYLTPNNQPHTTRAKGALRVTHAENTSRVDSCHAGAGCACDRLS
jgi:hypothetical protein